jgi:hypothetical protein
MGLRNFDVLAAVVYSGSTHLVRIARKILVPHRLLERSAQGMEHDICIGVAIKPAYTGNEDAP